MAQHSRRSAPTRPATQPAATAPIGAAQPWRAALFVLMVIAAVVLVYQPLWHAGYIWDDDWHLLGNPGVKPGGLLLTWTPGRYLNYWPLTFSLYWLEYRFWGLHALGFHLVNVGLHIAVVLLVWRVLLGVGLPRIAAMLAAAVFALHPVAVESVAWVSQTKTLLPALWALVAALFYLHFERRGGRWRYLLAVIAFALSALARGMAVTLPAVLLMLAWWRRGRIARCDLLRIAPLVVIGLAMACVEVYMQHHVAGQQVVHTDSLASRTLAAGWAVWFYLGKLIVPVNLSVVYPRWTVSPADPLHYVPGAMLVGVLGGAWAGRRRWGRAVVMVLGCYVALLFPALGLAHVGFARFSLVADHYQYLAMVVPLAAGVCGITSAVAAGRSRGKLWAGAGAAAAGLALLGGLSFAQAGIYHDGETMWKDVLSKNPKCWAAYNGLGVIQAEAGHPEQAIADFKADLDLNPDDFKARYNLGNALMGRGRIDQAIEQYRRAEAIEPHSLETIFNLGHALMQRGRFEEAAGQLEKVVAGSPGLAVAHYLLATALLRCGQTDPAIEQFKLALTLEPNHPEGYDGLGMALLQGGRVPEAIAQFHKALDLAPNDADARHHLDAAQRQGR